MSDLSIYRLTTADIWLSVYCRNSFFIIMYRVAMETVKF